MKKESFGNSRKCLGQIKLNIIRKMMKYEYKGNVYNYVGAGKFKDSTGKWIDAIIYERDNHIYMREITDFIDKFKRAEEENLMQEDALLRK
jgi:hypothetical protein